MSDRIEKVIEINAPVERVWRALTDHHEFGEWFGVRLDGPFAPGERSTGAITYRGYEHVKWEAEVQGMEPPRLFSFTWHPYAVDPNQDYSQEPPTLVEFRLEPLGEGTRLSVVETGFDKLPPARRPDALRMNDSGWTEELGSVKAHVEGKHVER
ncbi:MAG: SRPBCC family protein [Caulobacteraceae bacterium]